MCSAGKTHLNSIWLVRRAVYQVKAFSWDWRNLKQQAESGDPSTCVCPCLLLTWMSLWGYRHACRDMPQTSVSQSGPREKGAMVGVSAFLQGWPWNLCWFEWYVPIGLCIWTLDSQLMVLFGKVMAHLGGIFLHEGRMSLRGGFYDLDPLSAISASCVQMKCDQSTSHACHHAFPVYCHAFSTKTDSISLK